MNNMINKKFIDSIKLSDEFLESKNVTKKGIALIAQGLLNNVFREFDIMLECEKKETPSIEFTEAQKATIIRMLKTSWFISTCTSFEMITIFLKAENQLTEDEKERLNSLIIASKASKETNEHR